MKVRTAAVPFHYGYSPLDELHTKVIFFDDFQKMIKVDGNSKPRR
jgi:hypothetical protein